MNFNQAITILRKDEEEERNWRSARGKLAEVLEAAMAADRALEPVTKQKQALESDVAALRATYAKLDGDYQTLQKHYKQLDDEYRVKTQSLEATLSAVRAEVAAAQQLKWDTEAQLAKITADWHLKTNHPTA
jgi:chromosome segregation ATPase